MPKERDDDAYFAPLAGLRLKPGCELYLGLVHMTGGIDGTRRRIAAAERVAPEFGVATECGLARRPPETIPALLRQHAEVAGRNGVMYGRELRFDKTALLLYRTRGIIIIVVLYSLSDVGKSVKMFLINRSKKTLQRQLRKDALLILRENSGARRVSRMASCYT